MFELTETRRDVLGAVCDTVVPAITRVPDADGFFARKASDLWVPHVIEYLLADMPEEQRASLLALLDTLAGQDLLGCSPRSRERIVREVRSRGADVAGAIDALRATVLFLFYGLGDERGQNPNWRTLGYPGPFAPPPVADRPLVPYTPETDTTLEADVCVVGSGAGGGVMAGVLSEQGLSVVVLEAGGYFDDGDFTELEIPAYRNLYWRGGPTQTADLNVVLLAGACLGGGTVVNWTNSLRPTERVRDQWEREFGLDGLAGDDFEPHLDAVWERLGVTDRCSQLNRPQQQMKAGAEKLGWSFKLVQRNTDERRYSFQTAGYLGFGDPTGAKQSTVKTYLEDAYDRGAVLVTRCAAGASSSSAIAPSVSRRPGRTRRAAAARTSPSARRTWWWHAARSSPPRCCCARASAAPRSATTYTCTHPRRPWASTTTTFRPGRALPKPGSSTSSRIPSRATGF